MIPSGALTETLLITPAAGVTGRGERLSSTSFAVAAAVVGARGRVALPDGSTAVVEARAVIRPGAAVPLLSEVSWRSHRYRVAAVESLTERRGEAAIALTLTGAAS